MQTSIFKSATRLSRPCNTALKQDATTRRAHYDSCVPTDTPQFKRGRFGDDVSQTRLRAHKTKQRGRKPTGRSLRVARHNLADHERGRLSNALGEHEARVPAEFSAGILGAIPKCTIGLRIAFPAFIIAKLDAIFASAFSIPSSSTPTSEYPTSLRFTTPGARTVSRPLRSFHSALHEAKYPKSTIPK